MMKAVSNPLFIDGTFVTVPVLPAVQRLIEEWTNEHVADLDERLEPFGLSAADIVIPVYHRVVEADAV